MRFLLTIIILSVLHLAPIKGQNEIVKIVLEKGSTDVLTIKNQPINKAHVYGTHEDVIKFLINDKFIQHNINQGLIYNFILVNRDQDRIKPEEMQQRTDKILVLTQDSLSYVKLYNKINPGNETPEPIFRLSRVNNLEVFVSFAFNESFFSTDEEISQIVLDKEKSDAFQIEGEPMDIVSLYGSRENIIRFLINDKFIRHKVSESSNYVFTITEDQSAFYHHFQGVPKDKTRVLVVIDEDKDFLNIYNIYYEKNEQDLTNEMSIRIEDNEQMSLIILSPEKSF